MTPTAAAADTKKPLRPVPLLVGLLVGTWSLILLGLAYWPLAPLVPALLSAATIWFQRTRAFGVGAAAATSGAVVALLSEWLLLAV